MPSIDRVTPILDCDRSGVESCAFRMSASYHDWLAVHPVLGRNFPAPEMRLNRAPCVSNVEPVSFQLLGLRFVVGLVVSRLYSSWAIFRTAGGGFPWAWNSADGGGQRARRRRAAIFRQQSR